MSKLFMARLFKHEFYTLVLLHVRSMVGNKKDQYCATENLISDFSLIFFFFSCDIQDSV